jgi:hypothetical protein
LNSNFGLLNDTLIFTYNPYEITGYAEGQKKKVIYICDEEIFGDEESRKQGGERKIHFDIKQTRIIKFDFSSKEKIQIFKKEISSSIKASGLNIY